jgi:RNA polymerase primary sigma factor
MEHTLMPINPHLNSYGKTEKQSGRKEKKTKDVSRYYFRDIRKLTILPPQEQCVLSERAKAGDLTAREKLIATNLSLVISIAQRYQGCGLPLADLIQEGNLGLIRAIEKFNPNMGSRFSSYAVWWIRQSIVRALFQKSRLIRLPVNIEERLNRFMRVLRNLTRRLERNPTAYEIAEEMSLSTEQVLKLETLNQPLLVSLETEIGLPEESGGTLKDILEDKEATSPLEDAQIKNQHRQVAKLLARLSKRERAVIVMRFGLDDGEEKSLKTIGRRLGVNRDRVRQIETLALHKLRRLVVKKDWFEFW